MLDATTAGESTFRPHPDGSSHQECGRIPAPEWHVVATEHRAERLAQTSILALGFQTFLPLIRFRVAATKERPARTETAPAFPGYLFAMWEDADRWQRICSARGVASVLSQVGRSQDPAIVPEAVMAVLLGKASIAGILEDISAPDILPALKANTWVRITKGPLMGRLALCEWSSEERVSLLLELLGGERRTKVRRDFVEETEQPL